MCYAMYYLGICRIYHSMQCSFVCQFSQYILEQKTFFHILSNFGIAQQSAHNVSDSFFMAYSFDLGPSVHISVSRRRVTPGKLTLCQLLCIGPHRTPSDDRYLYITLVSKPFTNSCHKLILIFNVIFISIYIGNIFVIFGEYFYT